MKTWRKLLWPFVPFYYLGSLFVKKMYDWNFFKSTSYNFPVITVGNISAGGTGKSPFVAYLISLLKEKQLATLSRGYGRTTKGFKIVKENSKAHEIGDEPLQLKLSYPYVNVVVDEDRRNGIEQLKRINEPDVLILDDAFQHRKVKAGLQIILTAYYNLYSNDSSLPVGDLREPKSAAKRADVIIVTKCPGDLSKEDQLRTIKQLKPASAQKVYFTTIAYDSYVYSNETKVLLSEFLKEKFCLVTGIATPKPLLDFLQNESANFTHLNYPDHHIFSNEEINEMTKYDKVLTTQKDYMRLQHESTLFSKLFYLPIGVEFLNEEQSFKNCLFSFVGKY